MLMVQRILFAFLLACQAVQAMDYVTTADVDQALQYDSLLPAGPYRKDITPPEQLLGHPLGQRPVSPEELLQAVKTWVKQSPRLKLETYGQTHEGRPLVLVVVTDPARMDQLDAVQQAMQRLHDPEGLSDQEAESLIAQTPAVAWMAYSIHGNESSGSDAALALLYWLAASESKEVEQLLSELVIVVDPSMNPDGRARFVQSMREFAGQQPNVDHQSLQHRGRWPYGRTNHYWFDLNRDFIFGIHPETVGRIRAMNRWRPVFMIDAHEQGAMDTYLFAPPREPINTRVHPRIHRWLNRFSEAQATAFDARAWPYFNGEWFEDLYPGYSSYIQFKGTVHILYEQARLHQDGIRGYNGRLTAYAESVDHQFTSSRVNLETLRKHRKAMLADYLAEKREAISRDGPFAKTAFAVLPSANPARMKRFLHALDLQQFRYGWLDKAITVRKARDTLNRLRERVELPAGTLVIPARQPDARLLMTMLELDTQISPEVLKKEREGIIRDGSSQMYDVTAWNLGMMYDLPLYQIPRALEGKAGPPAAARSPAFDTQALAWIIPNRSDALPVIGARLMQAGVVLRRIAEAGELGGQSFPAGSLAVTRHDQHGEDWLDTVRAVAAESELPFLPTRSGLGAEDLPDIGGERFQLLYPPRIGLLVDEQTDDTDAGAIRWLLDTQLQLRHSLLNLAEVSGLDLRSYNVLLLPQRSGKLRKSTLKVLKTWVEQGGTLIATGRSSGSLLAAGEKWLKTRALPKALDKPQSARNSLHRQWLLQTGVKIDPNILARPWIETVEYPWERGKLSLYSSQQAREKDRWLKRFMPQGAFVAAAADTRHWLADGLEPQLPLLVSRGPVLIPPEEAETVVRLGVLENDSQAAEQALLWTAVPDKQRLRMRLSGLLWPEAALRLAASAWLVREDHGHGQVILFAQPPAFRGSTLAGLRALANAIVLGPGLGTEGEPVLP